MVDTINPPYLLMRGIEGRYLVLFHELMVEHPVKYPRVAIAQCEARPIRDQDAVYLMRKENCSASRLSQWPHQILDVQKLKPAGEISITSDYIDLSIWSPRVGIGS